MAVYNKNFLFQQENVFTPLQLTDVTLQAGIQRNDHITGLHESLGAGACAFDYNKDGWVDLLVLNGSGTTHFHGKPQWWQTNSNSLTLYKNNGDETFSDITDDSRLISDGWTMGCAYGDIDSDGDADIFISQRGSNQLWENDNGIFKDITEVSGIKGQHWSTSVNFVDINRDGLLDIYVNNFIDFQVNALTFEHHSGYEATLPPAFDMALYDGQPNQLWINQGGRRFMDRAKAMGIDNPQGRSLHAQWVDINADTYPDLLVANGKGSSNKVFLNQQGNTFVDASLDSGVSFTDTAHHISVGDINRDTRLDIMVGTDHTAFSKLYRQSVRQDTAFVDNSYQTLATVMTTNQSQWASIIEDINLDGWPDFYIANGLTTANQDAKLLSRGQPDSLLLYQQGFVDDSHQISLDTEHSHSSRCALATDFNNDGRADIYISHNNDLGQLLKNNGKKKPWLGIALLSETIPAHGAIVTITNGDMLQTQVYGNKHSFLCTGDQRLRFGINDASPIEITIDWPDGKQHILRDVTANRYHRIVYGKTETLPMTQPAIYTSQIVYQHALNKLKVIEWLIEQNRSDEAAQELGLLQHHPDTELRLQLLQAATLLPEAQQLRFIQRAFNDESITVRLQAIALTRRNENELLARWLFKQLEHDNADVVCATTSALAHFYDEEEAFIVHKYTALGALIRLLNAESETKQRCAIEALGRSEHYRALQPLLAVAERHASQNIRVSAIKALALIKEKAALPTLMAIAEDINQSTAIHAQAKNSIAIINGNYFVKPSEKSLSRKEENNSTSTFFNHKPFYKTPPTWVAASLAKDHADRAALLKAIAQRKERWARDIVHSVLSDTEELLTTKTAIIQQLPRPLSPGYQQLLRQLLQGAITQYQMLHKNDSDDENKFMALAEMIYQIDPERALEMVLH